MHEKTDCIDLAIAIAIIKFRNPKVFDISQSSSVPIHGTSVQQTSSLQKNDRTNGKVYTISAKVLPPSDFKTIKDLIPSNDKMLLNSAYLDELKPVFSYIRERSVSLFTFMNNRELFNSLGEGLDISSIQWMSKMYKRYRWLVGFQGEDKAFYIAQCLHTILVSYYSCQSSSKRIYRFVQETSFDKFIFKEIIGRSFHLNALKSIYGVDSNRINLRKVFAFQIKLIVRILILASNPELTSQFILHVMQIIEKMIRRLFKQRRIKMKKYSHSNAAFKLIFEKRHKSFTAISNNIQEDETCTIPLLFRFCLRILSPLIEMCKNYEKFDFSLILRNKRFIQAELLVLKDANFIMEFQLINWPSESVVGKSKEQVKDVEHL